MYFFTGSTLLLGIDRYASVRVILSVLMIGVVLATMSSLLLPQAGYNPRTFDDIREAEIENRERIVELQRRIYILEQQGSRPLEATNIRLQVLEKRQEEMYSLVRAIAIPVAVYFLQLLMTGLAWFQKQKPREP